jgi:hypothetical protein
MNLQIGRRPDGKILQCFNSSHSSLYSFPVGARRRPPPPASTPLRKNRRPSDGRRAIPSMVGTPTTRNGWSAAVRATLQTRDCRRSDGYDRQMAGDFQCQGHFSRGFRLPSNRQGAGYVDHHQRDGGAQDIGITPPAGVRFRFGSLSETADAEHNRACLKSARIPIPAYE